MQGFLGLTRSVWRTRALAGTSGPHVLVAEGAVGILGGASRLPLGPRRPSGDHANLAGSSPIWPGNATPEGGSAVCTNGRFHDEVCVELSRAHGLNPMGGGTRARGWHEPGPQGLPLARYRRCWRRQAVTRAQARLRRRPPRILAQRESRAPSGGRSVTSSSAAGSDGLCEPARRHDQAGADDRARAYAARGRAALLSARGVFTSEVFDSEHAGIGILTERDILDSIGAGRDPRILRSPPGAAPKATMSCTRHPTGSSTDSRDHGAPPLPAPGQRRGKRGDGAAFDSRHRPLLGRLRGPRTRGARDHHNLTGRLAVRGGVRQSEAPCDSAAQSRLSPGDRRESAPPRPGRSPRRERGR